LEEEKQLGGGEMRIEERSKGSFRKDMWGGNGKRANPLPSPTKSSGRGIIEEGGPQLCGERKRSTKKGPREKEK